MNINALGQVAALVATDLEYQRIIRELRALGLEPTGDKSTDKSRLEAAKAQKSAQNDYEIQIQIQTVENVKNPDKAGPLSDADFAKNTPTEAAQNMRGAEQLGQLNKLKLLGLY
uniref:hypothetical protein n=1 Tax=Candidatus Scatousia sp. TaxID=3085663 RepID=UPI004025D24A